MQGCIISRFLPKCYNSTDIRQKEVFMKKTTAQKPVLFTVLLLIAAMFAAAAFTVVFTFAGFPSGIASSVGRLIITAVLMVIYRTCFRWENSFKGIVFALPALILAVWNVAYNTLGGAVLRADILPVILTALAPALFEETIFRVIPFQKMQENGFSALKTIVITAVIFGLIHLTNIVGGNVIGTLVQTGYATAIGLLFGGIYILTKDPASVFLLHFLTDFSSQIFTSQPTSTPLWGLALMLVLIAGISVYGIMLAKKADHQ